MSMKTPHTALVILNWNGKHLLERFLPGITEHTHEDVELIVADNASDDGSIEYLAKRYPAIRVISLDKNYGFAGGYNRALKEVEAGYYILLNSDMAVTQGWTEPCIEILQKNDDIAAIQPKIRSLVRPSAFEYAGAAGGFADYLGYPFCRGRIFDTVEEDNGQYDDVCDVFWASGAALFIRSEAFHQVGGFDDRFFAHMEEIDLCWRLHHAGYRIMVCPQSVVYHLGGGSLSRSNPGKTYLNFRNNLWMLAKNLPVRHFYIRLLLRIIMDTAAAIKFLFTRGQMHDCLAVMKAYWSFFGSLGSMRRESRNISGSIPLYKNSIVKDYFFLGKKTFSDLRFKASSASR